MRTKKNPLQAGIFRRDESLSALNIGGLLALRTLRNRELNFLTFCEGLETVHVDCGKMREQILAAIIWRDKTETFCIVEPLDSTCFHIELSNKIKIKTTIKE